MQLFVKTTWGQRWLKDKNNLNTNADFFFYQVTLFVDTLIKVTGEDRQFHRWDIWSLSNTRVNLLCWGKKTEKNSIIVYTESISVTLGRIHNDPNGCMRNNKHSLISQFFWIASQNWTHAWAPVSKNRLVYQRPPLSTNRISAMMAGSSTHIWFQQMCSCSKWVVLHWFVSRQRKNNLGASTS